MPHRAGLFAFLFTLSLFLAACGGSALSAGNTAASLAATVALPEASVNASGAAANGASTNGGFSPDGRYLAFESSATNLAANVPTDSAEIYLRDTCHGAPAGCSPATVLVSLAADGSPAAGSGGFPMAAGLFALSGSIATVSQAGRFVVYVSHATNLAPSAPPGQLYLSDTCLGARSGCTRSTTLVSADAGGNPGLPDAAGAGQISADGRLIAYTGLGGILLRDTCAGAAGCTPATTTIGTSDVAQFPTLSADGKRVAFQVGSSVQVAATCLGVSGCSANPSTVSLGLDGTPAVGTSAMDALMTPALSGNGRFVAFNSSAATLTTAGGNGHVQVYVRDTCAGATGACVPATTLVSSGSSSGLSDNDSFEPALSADGRYVAFLSIAGNLTSTSVPAGAPQIYVRDTCAGQGSGCTPSTHIVSVDALGLAGAGGASGLPALSPDGHWVAFTTTAANLAANASATSAEVVITASGY